MNFDPNNKVMQLCAQGMGLEGEGKIQEASDLFLKAWDESITDLEKFTAAHYVARHQRTITGKLKWDETALFFALKLKNEGSKTYLPSLYLNIAKCHEDLNDFDNARKHYELAQSFSQFLPGDGYGKMIASGIKNGLDRSAEIEKSSN
ncbi:MAG: rRNA adenine methyltransferase [Ferruginibacter sp.]